MNQLRLSLSREVQKHSYSRRRVQLRRKLKKANKNLLLNKQMTSKKDIIRRDIKQEEVQESTPEEVEAVLNFNIKLKVEHSNK